MDSIASGLSGVDVGVLVDVAVAVGVDVWVGAVVGVREAVGVADGADLAVGAAVFVGAGVSVGATVARATGAGVGVGVGCPPHAARATASPNKSTGNLNSPRNLISPSLFSSFLKRSLALPSPVARSR